MVKRYPIGIQNFEKIRKDGCLYIDKTAIIYRLVNEGSYYFLSRPRRFGKSLLISTLEAYFEGKKELFDGLAIGQLEKDWIAYPVLHLDLNIAQYDSTDSLYKIVNDALARWEEVYGTRPSEKSLPLRFAGVVERAYLKTGQRVVILIDEFDKPLLQTLQQEELQTQLRNMLKPFYGVLKSMDKYIRFALLTGVTKVGKVSVFSDLNNLMDISMDYRYADICGITENEIHANLEEELHTLASTQKMTYDEVCEELEKRYDGYHFVPDSVGIYNPFSLLNTFAKMELGNYWFETGTPTYLVELLKHTDYNLYKMAHTETDADVLNSIDASSYNPIPVIYQSGYLTIKGYDERFRIYKLGFPNDEVKYGFLNSLIPYYTSLSGEENTFHIRHFVSELEEGDTEAFLQRMKVFFSSIPYELHESTEKHYQAVFYLVFRLLGQFINAEVRSANGRADAVVKTEKFIYVFEFKLDGSAEDALKQIDDKGYMIPYTLDGKSIIKIGVNFDMSIRNIADWKVEK